MSEKALDRASVTIFHKDSGQVELNNIAFPNEKLLWNAEIHPIPVNKRTWGWSTYFWIWISMAFIIPSWTLASVGLELGLNVIQSILIVFLGNTIVLIPMIIQSHGGARYGLAEPQLTRTRWGVYGAIFPSWVRAIIGAGWWGIESYIIAEAITGIYAIITNKLAIISYTVSHYSDYPFILSKDFPLIFWFSFILIIIFQIIVFYLSPIIKSQPVLKWLAKIGGPLVLAGFLTLWIFFMNKINWNLSYLFYVSSPSSSPSTLGILAFLNANIAFWATMALTMPDYTRFAKNQFSQTIGQIPLPFIMLIIAFMASLTTGASLALYGKAIWDPIVLATLYMPSFLSIPVLLAIILATFLVNVFANAVGPSYDISNTFPRKLSWFKGSLILVVIGLSIGAWSFYGNAYSYINNWLLTYGGLLGSIEGIIIFDYALLRRFKFDLVDVFLSKGRFRYWKGVNPAAIITFLLVSLIIYLPYRGENIMLDNAWILSFILSGIIYVPLMVLWIIPKYQKCMKGSLITGYYSEDTIHIFNMKK
ncbi:transporter [Acidianus sulfidivorans JP7]|uniref:Transporter n=1 Tax=Acidianus sulfidivorans JP7 TaxID=619593 RepID=A0A2U9ILT7_9CREN|nr:cytosine permease [Acidianus sulfidivorans]AWR96970.1 transporter [Acidianus sulfidivorans JP7]